MPAPRTVCFKTIGCRLNQAETGQIAAQFDAAGYQRVEGGTPCDVAVVNTCTVTQSAERDCARWARRLRRDGARIVILAGCAVEHDGERLKQETGVDLIANQTDKFRLIELLHAPGGVDPDPSVAAAEPLENAGPLFSTARALVKAQDGCDFRCSYCIVPDTRGLSRSRPCREVLDDVRRLAEQGYREITVTGANLGCYRDGGHGLVQLLEAIEGVEGIVRMRIGSIESTTVERGVIDFMATSSKLCHFLHIPLQSGDDDTLSRMQRRYTTAQYRDVVTYAVSCIPDLGLGTDVIVGFPGETESEFENTVRCVRELPFSNLHVFSYSPRAGTPAATLPEQVDDATRKARSTRLVAMGKTKRTAFAQAFIGKSVTALIEHVDDNGLAHGWSAQYLAVRMTATGLRRNDIHTVTPTRIENDVLLA